MTSEDIQKLYDLKKKLDAGSISQEAFNKEVAAIRGYSGGNTNNASSNEGTSQENQELSSKDTGGLSKKNVIIAIVMAAIMVGVIIMGVVNTAHNRSNYQGSTTTMFPDETIVKNVIERYCNAICNNDFETLSSIYAPKVDRFQDAYDKDREYVLDCHRRYDKKFKVYGKHSSIRWDSFEMTLLSNGYIKVSIIEDYSIDRQECDKYSVFVLEKHFLFDTSYNIVSVYDRQLGRATGLDYKTLYQTYVREHNLSNEVDEYSGGWEYLFIDDDDIPELHILTGYACSGSYILSIVDGMVVAETSSEIFSYIPYRNKILSGRGMHMNINCIYIETLINGKLQLLATVEADYNDGDEMREEPLWYVNEKMVSEARAKSVIEDLYNRYGDDEAAGSHGNNLRPMDEFWQ